MVYAGHRSHKEYLGISKIQIVKNMLYIVTYFYFYLFINKNLINTIILLFNYIYIIYFK
jgi:hypothetical protein